MILFCRNLVLIPLFLLFCVVLLQIKNFSLTSSMLWVKQKHINTEEEQTLTCLFSFKTSVKNKICTAFLYLYVYKLTITVSPWLFWEIVKDRGAWRAVVHGATKSRTWLSTWTTTNLSLLYISPILKHTHAHTCTHTHTYTNTHLSSLPFTCIQAISPSLQCQIYQVPTLFPSQSLSASNLQVTNYFHVYTGQMGFPHLVLSEFCNTWYCWPSLFWILLP